ncbi:hypothetical protein CROQUDRAFT_383918 [Cronartium quercuum f. sp. fusiforme G11]|uniref:Protein kinase domain-containing protein n=1 Tax=Cronartium quercuum f. sp. fusiforme G11 TaxID=708437 RepID=A0A9P6NQZ4_9BASI|nr:hypothetical protein CROQUDRAFT_383918 [Cronartium quercuum f. sp. fusiforme G11]
MYTNSLDTSSPLSRYTVRTSYHSPSDLTAPIGMNLGNGQFSTNHMGYSSSSTYPLNPHHHLPSQPGMSRRSANPSWNDNTNNTYNPPPTSAGPHSSSQGTTQPPRLHFSVQVPGNSAHQYGESSATSEHPPGPGSPMNATPTYLSNLAGNPPHDSQTSAPYLPDRSPQVSPRGGSHHLHQHSSAYATGAYGDSGSGTASGSSRGMAYSPSQYALHSISHSNAQPHIGSSSAVSGAPLLPQHHSAQPSIYSPNQPSGTGGYLSHTTNPGSTHPPPPANYSSANPSSSSYFTSVSSSVGLPPPTSAHGPPSSAPTSSRHSLSQSNQHSSSLSSSSDQYYASRSASGASSQRPRRSTEGLGFRRLVRGSSDLRPVINNVPPERRLDPINGGYISPLKALTIHLASTYRLINPNFRYELSLNPRRVLTKPSRPAANNGMDNEDSDYILYVNDILGGGSSGESGGETTEGQGGRSTSGHKYLILDVLGQGTFGQVVKCQDMKNHEVVAVKVVKNKQAYFSQSMMEVTILELLNNTWDPDNKHHILRMKDTFIHHNHLCLVFELLSSNLYELIKQNSFRGLSTSLVRVFTNQLLDALTVLNEARLIHCDLKPENILLNSLSSPEIKVIDFGSACHERQTVYTYIQSRFYRSPEVILGLPYSSAIDMWSLGCICVELFLGLPLFPGTSEFNQITRIVEMLGMPPTYMLEVGKQTLRFFDVEDDFNGGRKLYKLKSLEQYSKEHNVNEQPSKRYFPQDKLEDIISQYPVMRKGMKPADLEKEKQNRIAFIDFVKGLLNLNPIERWSPQQARMHPFILGEPLREPYVPLRPGYSATSGSLGKLTDLGTKLQSSSSAHAPMDTQPSSHQHSSNGNNVNTSGSGVNDVLAKRPYGGLPAAPARSGQKVYDAAAYSQLQAQQQAINAQAAALRQHQAQAAQQSQNPYALPHETTRSNASQQQSLQPATHQQSQQHTTSGSHHLQHQYSANRLQATTNAQQHHHQHQQQIGSTSNPISMQQAYYGSRDDVQSSSRWYRQFLDRGHR